MKNILVIITSVIFSFTISCSAAPTSTPEPFPIPDSTKTAVLEIVTIPDEQLEAAIRNAFFLEGIKRKDEALLKKPLEEDITVAELAKIVIMEARSKNIINLSGLEYCVNLTELYLTDNKIEDISSLSSLTNLIKLDLGANQINDVSPISSLNNLIELDLYANHINNISPLSSLTNLVKLYLFRNQISDASPLSSLTNLTELDLFANQISDISPLLDNDGLGKDDIVRLAGNNLDLQEGSEDMLNIQALRDRGVVIVLE